MILTKARGFINQGPILGPRALGCRARGFRPYAGFRGLRFGSGCKALSAAPASMQGFHACCKEPSLWFSS